MKPILTYYGGKQRIMKHILELIPEHEVYVEPFAGGAALFFAKPLAKINVLNDTWDELVFFYRYVQRNKERFLEKLNEYPYARSVHREFTDKRGAYESDEERAVALYYLINASFSHGYCNGFSFGKKRNEATTYFNRIEWIDGAIDMLKEATIDDVDATVCIERYDSDDTLFYIDPPYIGSTQNYVKRYCMDDFVRLLDVLKGVKGKWILSHYWNDALKKFVRDGGHQYKEVQTKTHAKKGVRDDRTEVLVYKV